MSCLHEVVPTCVLVIVLPNEILPHNSDRREELRGEQRLKRAGAARRDTCREKCVQSRKNTHHEEPVLRNRHEREDAHHLRELNRKDERIDSFVEAVT